MKKYQIAIVAVRKKESQGGRGFTGCYCSLRVYYLCDVKARKETSESERDGLNI